MAKTKNKKPTNAPGDNFKKRLLVTGGLLALYGITILGKLFYLQILQHEELWSQSERQYIRKVKTSRERGKILDRNLVDLAANVEVDSVYINPRSIVDKQKTANTLSEVLGLSYRSTLKKVSSKKKFVWVKRKSSLQESKRLKQLSLPGVGFKTEIQRFYPKRQLAAGTLGFVGMDNQGLSGVEHFHDTLLKGLISLKSEEKDARGRYFRGPKPDKIQPDRSPDLVLTLDEVIQYYVETELEKAVKKYRAKGGVAVVMAPNTGEILALANLPTYNPNNYSVSNPSSWKNIAISSSFEPGSIFKPIIAAAAIETGAASPEKVFFCENGSYRIGKTEIGEAAEHKFGWLSLAKIIQKSSNIGVIKISEELGPSRYYDYIRKFGFGSKSGIDLPGEASGQLRPLDQWSKLSAASISFGHEIGATPIQLVSAISAIANGGNLMKPYIAQAVVRDEETLKEFKPQLIRRVISEKTSRQMVEILKTVVKEGTGKKAGLLGYETAGKTGTAQKIDPETQSYSNSAYVSSFVGFAPADAPRIAILVMIDEPKRVYWGGEIAAPAFREIARQTLRYLNVPSKEERVVYIERA
jgi:cell division protein FtsI (penicillin-binding protein 3)